MEIEFYAIFTNEIIKKSSFKEVKNIPYKEFILEKKLHHSRKTDYGNTYKEYSYRVLSDEGKPINLKIGNFEIIDISPDNVGFNRNERTITVFDKKNKTAHKYISKSNFESNFYNDTINKLEKLNRMGSWEGLENKEIK